MKFGSLISNISRDILIERFSLEKLNLKTLKLQIIGFEKSPKIFLIKPHKAISN